MKGSRVGDQLALALGEGFLVGASSLPWEGRSPRALTRGYVRFTLKAQAGKSMGDFVDPEQRDFWLPIKKAPPIYGGGSFVTTLEGGA